MNWQYCIGDGTDNCQDSGVAISTSYQNLVAERSGTTIIFTIDGANAKTFCAVIM